MSKYITQDRLIRVLFGDDEGYFGSEFDNFGDSKPDELLEVMMNCLGKPLIDASGRNFLHKAIILNSDQEDFVIKLLKIDKEHLLYKGKLFASILVSFQNSKMKYIFIYFFIIVIEIPKPILLCYL